MTQKDFEQVIKFAKPRMTVHLSCAVACSAVICGTLAASGLPPAQNWLDCCLAVVIGGNSFFAGIHFAAWQLADVEINALRQDAQIRTLLDKMKGETE